MKGVGGYIYASFIIQFIVYPPHKSSSQLDLCKMILMRGALPILARWVVYIGSVHQTLPREYEARIGRKPDSSKTPSPIVRPCSGRRSFPARRERLPSLEWHPHTRPSGTLTQPRVLRALPNSCKLGRMHIHSVHQTLPREYAARIGRKPDLCKNAPTAKPLPHVPQIKCKRYNRL